MMMKLEPSEKRWLKEFRRELARQFPGQIERLSVYGSKARGDSHQDSDLDVLLIVKDTASRLKTRMRRVGYLLAAEGRAVPSILAFTHQEWTQRGHRGSPFRKAVERDEVRVL